MGMLNRTTYECSPEVFAEICKSLLMAGKSVRFKALGDSMFPFLHNGDLVIVEPMKAECLKTGEVILYEDGVGHLLLHRIIRKRNNLPGSVEFQIQADNILKPDGWVSSERVFGRLTQFYQNGVWLKMDSIGSRAANLLVLAKLKLNLNKYRRFRSGRKYFHRLPVLCRIF